MVLIARHINHSCYKYSTAVSKQWNVSNLIILLIGNVEIGMGNHHDFCLREKHTGKKYFGYNLLANRMSYLSYILINYFVFSMWLIGFIWISRIFVISLLLEISKHEKSKFWLYNQATFHLQTSSISNFKKNILNSSYFLFYLVLRHSYYDYYIATLKNRVCVCVCVWGGGGVGGQG